MQPLLKLNQLACLSRERSLLSLCDLALESLELADRAGTAV